MSKLSVKPHRFSLSIYFLLILILKERDYISFFQLKKLTGFDYSREKLKEGKWEINVDWTDGGARYFMESEVVI